MVIKTYPTQAEYLRSVEHAISPRHADILRLLWVEKLTRSEVAKTFDVTMAHIGRIDNHYRLRLTCRDVFSFVHEPIPRIEKVFGMSERLQNCLSAQKLSLGDCLNLPDDFIEQTPGFGKKCQSELNAILGILFPTKNLISSETQHSKKSANE